MDKTDKEILSLFHQLSPEQRAAYLNHLQAIAEQEATDITGGGEQRG